MSEFSVFDFQLPVFEKEAIGHFLFQFAGLSTFAFSSRSLTICFSTSLTASFF